MHYQHLLQNCRLEALGMRIDKTGKVKIKATPQHQGYVVVSTSKEISLLVAMDYSDFQLIGI